MAAGLLFPYAAQAIQIRRRRRPAGTKKWSAETSYAITSLSFTQASAAELAAIPAQPPTPNDHEVLNDFAGPPASVSRRAAACYRRLRVTWVTPLGLLAASMWKRSSSASSPSQSRSPRPSTMGTTTMCT